MSQKFTLYDDLTIRQNLELYCGVSGIPRKLRRSKINWVLETCGLIGQENSLTKSLPGGWKQRVAFGVSVMHEPDLLFLDEPTSGVDPLARRQFWRLIRDFARQGTAILVTTHYLEEAERRVAIFGDRLHLVLDRPDRELMPLIQNLQEHQIEIQAQRSIPFTLEDAFIGVVQRAEAKP